MEVSADEGDDAAGGGQRSYEFNRELVERLGNQKNPINPMKRKRTFVNLLMASSERDFWLRERGLFASYSRPLEVALVNAFFDVSLIV